MGFAEETSIINILGKGADTNVPLQILSMLYAIGIAEVGGDSPERFLTGLNMWNIDPQAVKTKYGVSQSLNCGPIQYNGWAFLNFVKELSKLINKPLTTSQLNFIERAAGLKSPTIKLQYLNGRNYVRNFKSGDTSTDEAAHSVAEWLDANIGNADTKYYPNREILLQLTLNNWSVYFNAARKKWSSSEDIKAFGGSICSLFLLCDVANQFGTGAMNWLPIKNGYLVPKNHSVFRTDVNSILNDINKEGSDLFCLGLLYVNSITRAYALLPNPP